MWSNPQGTEDLATFTEEILNGTLHCFGQCKFKWNDVGQIEGAYRLKQNYTKKSNHIAYWWINLLR